MSSATVNYRVRVRDVGDTTDALVLTSVRGSTNPVISKAPSGDGQELDPVAGSMVTGQYTIEMVDPVIVGSSPPSRVITSQLFDSVGRQLLLSRRCYIEISSDGGSTWPTVLVAGYVMGYRLPDAITWEFTVGDTRRIENTKQVFDGASTTFAQRGCLFGGPINGGAWGPIPDRGGWKFKVLAVVNPSAGVFSGWVDYVFVNGYRGINDPLTPRYSDMINGDAQSVVAMVNQAAQSYYAPSTPQIPATNGYYGTIPPGWGASGFPGVVLRIKEYLGSANAGLFIPGCFTDGTSIPPQVLSTDATWMAHYGAVRALWPAGVTMPSVGDIHTISSYTNVPTDDSPVYLDLHPVDIATGIYTDAGIPYDATAAANLKTLMGSTMRVAMRVTQASTLLDFLEKSLFGPFGFSSRTSGAGVAQLFATRIKNSAVPTTTIGTSDLQDASGTIFDNDEQTVVSIVRFRSKLFWAYNPNTQTDTSSRPLDSVMESDSSVRVVNVDPNVAYSTQEVVYEIPGMIHDVSGVSQDMNAFTSAVAVELFDRFGRGGPVCDALAVLSTSDTGFQVGDEIYVDPAHFPNLNYRFGDNPSVGARIMQILRRTETPAGPLIKVIDAGSNQQPVTPAAVITIAANTRTPRSVAQFTITNAAAINTAASLIVAVQWATGGSSPTNGVDFARYFPASCPTVAMQLPPVAPGSTVWVRARTESFGLRPSAWTSWVSVTLSAVAAPTGLTFSPIYQNAAQFNWTNANTTDAIDVYVFQGSSAPSDWSPYFVCTLQPGSTSCLVRNLNGPSITYQGAVFHRDPLTGKIGAVLTGGLTTNSTPVSISPNPLGFEILPTTQDASLKTGIVLALYPADPVYDFIIQRAPDVSGAPGTFATIAQVSGSTQIFVDPLPNDGVKRWYQVAQILSSSTISTYAAFLSAIPGGVATAYIRPPFTLPQLEVVVAQVSSIGSATTISVTVLDPQGGGGTCTVTPSSSGVTSVIDLTTGLPAAPYTATIGVARSFQINLNAPFAGSGYVSFRAVETSRYDGYAVWFGPSALQNAAPAMTIAIGTSHSAADPSATTSAVISGPSNAASLKWLASTSSQPSAASVQATGTVISSGSPWTIADLSCNLFVAPATPDTVYLTVVYYDSVGNPQTAAMGSATRDSLISTRVANYSASQFTQSSPPLAPPGTLNSLNWTIDEGTLGDGSLHMTDDFYAPPTITGSAQWSLHPVLPDGATVVAVNVSVYNDVFMARPFVGAGFGRIDSNVLTLLTNYYTSLATGWQLLPVFSGTELTTGRSYAVFGNIVQGANSSTPGGTNHQRLGNTQIQYTVPGDAVSL